MVHGYGKSDFCNVVERNTRLPILQDNLSFCAQILQPRMEIHLSKSCFGILSDTDTFTAELDSRRCKDFC